MLSGNDVFRGNAMLAGLSSAFGPLLGMILFQPLNCFADRLDEFDFDRCSNIIISNCSYQPHGIIITPMIQFAVCR